MLAENILQSDLLDILFDNRNKAYGAYELRKKYHKRLFISLALVLSLVIILSFLITLSNTSGKQNTGIILPPDLHITEVNLQPKAIEPVVKKQVKKTESHKGVKLVDKIVLVHKDFDTIPTVHALENAIISDMNMKGEPSTIEVVSSSKGKDETGEITKEPMAEEPHVFEHAEVMPQFPGGVDAFQKFMRRNIIQPDDLETGEKIIVRVKFVIDKDGSISTAEILQSGRPDLDKEVLRVLRKMPRWIPGMQNGRNVAVYFQLPVTFVTPE